MDHTDLCQRVCDTVHGFLQLGNEVFSAAGATFVRSRECPRRYDANHVTDIRCGAAADVERLVARAEREFAGYPYLRFDIDPFTPPPFVARVVLDGYVTSETLQLVLEGGLDARSSNISMRHVDTDADWSDYALLQHLEWQETTAKLGRPFDAAVAAEFVTSKRKKSPPVRYWLAWVDGVPRAYVCAWPGRNGVGMVEDLFTHPEFRHRGVATALIACAVADARGRGAGPVVIGADSGDTPKLMYAHLGFRPLLVTRQYMRFVRR